MRIEEGSSLKAFNTFRIGGPARYLVKVHTEDEVREALIWAKARGLPFCTLGKGSNCLFDDRGFAGLVLLNRLDFFRPSEAGLFEAGAGMSFARLGIFTSKKGWAGLEFAAGIPASVGGAVFMNAGANGQEVKDTLRSVRFMNPDGKVEEWGAADLDFSYRTSPFQKRRGVILSASFQLEADSSARERQLRIIEYRQRTQPYGQPSAGCVFRNVPEAAAGQLIEACGLKGQGLGDAEISDLHANFIINRGEASAQDVLSLIDRVRDRVATETGLYLEPEIRRIPYEGEEDVSS